jgi:myo-inositol-hexaphosphate 3-phosphohydrolase
MTDRLRVTCSLPRRGAIIGGATQTLTSRIGADSTDGLDLVSSPLGPEFPDGLLVAMNSAPRTFLLTRWKDVASALGAAAVADRRR